MKAQLFLAVLLTSSVALAAPKKVKAKTVKKKEKIAKKVEPCITPTPAKLDPKTISLQGLGTSTGCKLPE